MKNLKPVAIGVSSYVLAILIILHWVFICSADEFFHLYKKGFSPQTIEALPVFLKPVYEGVPNLITLICFMLFTFSAFFLVEERKKSHFYMSLSSFLMIIYLFLFLVKI